ncbi:MAG: PQQ-binding-like beta-propeller repeat protein [Planctomycetota bacterium]
MSMPASLPRSAARWLPGRLAALLLAASLAVACGAQTQIAERHFSVLHISDIHVDPHLARLPAPTSQRSTEGLAWIAAEAGRPTEIKTGDPPAPPPAFALATGDLTEYGVTDDTWEVFERLVAPLPCKVYALAGNHDNTWTAMYHVLRKRHGGENYSFDHAGCHFVCLSSASPQEPVPSIDGKTRAWLRADLERTGRTTPVFVALHHPLYSDEFANPAERDTLIDLLRDYNVVLLLYGHGHNAVAHDNGGIPGVMGGSTFGKHTGYGLLTVRGDDVQYAYHFMRDPKAGDTGKPAWKVLWSGRLRKGAAPRLFDMAAPAPDARLAGAKLAVRLRIAEAAREQPGGQITVRLDGEEHVNRALENQAGAGEPAEFALATKDLTPGAHLLSVTLKLRGGATDTRTRVFYLEPGAPAASARAGPQAVEVLWRRHFPAAFKAAPLRVKTADADWLIIAGTDGVIRGLDPGSGDERWTFASGGEILGAPAGADGPQPLLVFGSGDGQVYAVEVPPRTPPSTDAGRKTPAAARWTFNAGQPVYGPPLIDTTGAQPTVYIGDHGGRLHALNLADGRPRWTFNRADFSIEARPSLWGELVVFGAWDGYLYAVNRTDGALRWKTLGPSSAAQKGSRYYAPADCPTVVLDKTLFVCDRGYRLGTYDTAGRPLESWANQACGIAAGADGRSVYVRTTLNQVIKLDPAGQPLWESAVPAGRFPIPPTEHAGVVYVCSNRGLLSALDARDGRALWSHQVTPGFYVMAPLCAYSGAGRTACYVAGTDGSVTALGAVNAH